MVKVPPVATERYKTFALAIPDSGSLSETIMETLLPAFISRTVLSETTGRLVSTVTSKLALLEDVWPATSTVIFPSVAPKGTLTTILVVVGVPVMVAVVPLNLTMLLAALVLKLVPVIVTAVLAEPLVGLKEVMVGGGTKIKPALLAVPPGVVTETPPDAPEATMAVMVVEETLMIEAEGTPPKVAPLAPERFVPVMVTVAPIPALVGSNEEIVGAGIKVNPAFAAVPPGVVMETSPEAPDPTTAVILVGETTL